MIYLNAEVISGLGEDTFWTWAKREIPGTCFATPYQMDRGDVILRYSTLGPVNVAGKMVALLWELLPEMREVFHSDEWDEKLKKVYACARYATWRVVASELMKSYYEPFGTVDVLPIGVDTEIFKPMDRAAMRRKHNIPAGKTVGFWGGTTHPMKGFGRLKLYAEQNPEVHWICVWKQGHEAGQMPGGTNVTQVSQPELAELMNCADFVLSCGMLRPFYMIEWEAMSCNLPVIITDGRQKDFVPSNHPRNDVIEMGWDRMTARQTWMTYLAERGVKL